MFKTRLLSGIVLVALALLFIILGGPVLLVVTLALSLIGMMELYRVIGMHKSLPGVLGYLAAAALYTGLYFWQDRAQFAPFALTVGVVFLLVLLSVYVFRYPRYENSQILMIFFGFFYVAVLFSYLYRVRCAHAGQYAVWLIFLTSWGADTCAYCVGVLFGKHKMAPVLSPKKSWEGAVGGIVGAALLTGIYCFVFRGAMHLAALDIVLYMVFAAVAAVVSIVGDLTASAIKRQFEVKDYGRLIPGHGGVLDRFDSMLFTAPVIYFATALLTEMGKL